MDVVGKLLVAPPAQDDSFWARSVIYIYEQNQSSVVGLVLNKTAERTVAQLADHHELDYDGTDMIYVGGPVNSSALVMLHTDDWTSSNTMHVLNGLRVSSDRRMLSRLCKGDRPEHWRMFLGMSGWTPMQLEGELSGTPPWSKKKAWLVAPADLKVVFEPNADRMWKKAIDLAVHEMTESYFTIN